METTNTDTLKQSNTIRELGTYNLFMSACPVPTYLAWRCSSCELILNLSLA